MSSPEILEPQIVSIAETDFDNKALELGQLIIDTAKPISLVHDHFTCRDDRESSIIRRTPPLKLDNNEYLREVYELSAQKIGTYLGKHVTRLQTDSAAAGHIYQAGHQASEAHVDYYPSVTWYLENADSGGELVIAKNPDAKNIDEIEEDAWVIQPEPETLVLFDGQNLPHYVRGVQLGATGRRISVNFSFASEDRPSEEGPESYGQGYFSAWPKSV